MGAHDVASGSSTLFIEGTDNSVTITNTCPLFLRARGPFRKVFTGNMTQRKYGQTLSGSITVHNVAENIRGQKTVTTSQQHTTSSGDSDQLTVTDKARDSSTITREG